MTQHLYLKLKLKPTIEQSVTLNKHFGCCRFVYNYYLNERLNFYETRVKGVEDKNGRKEVWKEFKETPLTELKKMYTWLYKIVAQNLCCSQIDLQTAFDRFYKGVSKLPKFKRKKSKNSFRSCQIRKNFIDVNNRLINLPKIFGKIQYLNKNLPKWYFKYKNKEIKSYTCSKTPSGQYYISILFEVNDFITPNKPKLKDINENQMIGLDFDCDDMYVDSNGNSAKLHGFVKQKQKNLKRLSHLQRQLERCKKDSNNREKRRRKLAKFEEHITNARHDWIEKETLRLVKLYKLIGIEDLNIKGMMKGSRNAKNYEDISWHTFISKLLWKAELYGCHVIKVNRFYPSSQTCSNCGYKNKEVSEKHLENWTCPNCKTKHNRDLNAAKNILNECKEILRNIEESQRVLCEAEESVEKSFENLSKDQHSVMLEDEPPAIIHETSCSKE